MRAVFLAVLFAAAPAPVQPAGIDCVNIQNLLAPPPGCNYPATWCNCLTTLLTVNEGGKPTLIDQRIIDVIHEPAFGKYRLHVAEGTLRLGSVAVGDSIGKMSIDIPYTPDNFTVVFEMIATLVSADYVEFDVTITNDINPTTHAILTYDPRDPDHSSGLTYRGRVQSLGPGGGFDLAFEYLDYVADPSLLPPGASSAGIRLVDFQDPHFSVPIDFTFPAGGASFLLPQTSPLHVVSTIDEIHPLDPTSAFENTFEESIFINVPSENFRRGDANSDQVVDLSDVIHELEYLYLDGAVPGCLDAADANDDGAVDLTDPLRILFSLFSPDVQLAAPGPSQCGPDAGEDDLPPCDYSC